MILKEFDKDEIILEQNNFFGHIYLIISGEIHQYREVDFEVFQKPLLEEMSILIK